MKLFLVLAILVLVIGALGSAVAYIDGNAVTRVEAERLREARQFEKNAHAQLRDDAAAAEARHEERVSDLRIRLAAARAAVPPPAPPASPASEAEVKDGEVPWCDLPCRLPPG